MSKTRTPIVVSDVDKTWAEGGAECRKNWMQTAQLPPMPSELLLIAKDRLIGTAVVTWSQRICEMVVGLRSELSAERIRREAAERRLDAYIISGRKDADAMADAYLTERAAREQAEARAECERLREDAERLDFLENEVQITRAAIDIARGKKK